MKEVCLIDMVTLKNRPLDPSSSKLLAFDDDAFNSSEEELNFTKEEKSNDEDSEDNEEEDMNDFQFDDTSELITTQMFVERKINELKSQPIPKNQTKKNRIERLDDEDQEFEEGTQASETDDDYNSDEAEPMEEGDSDEEEQDTVHDGDVGEREFDSETYDDVVREKEIQRKKEFF